MQQHSLVALADLQHAAHLLAAQALDIADYRRLRGQVIEFTDYLRSGPAFDDLELERASEYPRNTDWSGRT